jgi:hypothetical protein
MGGSGSGRRGWKLTTSAYDFIDIRMWRREGRINAGTDFWWMKMAGPVLLFGLHVSVHDFCLGIEPVYFRGKEKIAEPSIVVWLERTQCNFGGKRTWFGCSGCERRVTKLYIVRRLGSLTQFRCRSCLELAYDSQQLCRRKRCLYAAGEIRESLGASGSLAEPIPTRPSGMRVKKYQRIIAKLRLYEAVVFGGFVVD